MPLQETTLTLQIREDGPLIYAVLTPTEDPSSCIPIGTINAKICSDFPEVFEVFKRGMVEVSAILIRHFTGQDVQMTQVTPERDKSPQVH